MRTKVHAVLLVASAFGASGCSTLMFWQDDKPQDGAATSEEVDADTALATGGKSSPKPKTSALEEQELKLAKLWARVDELEEEQYRQKERFRVIEKGMTLGLVPEELKAPQAQKVEPKVATPVEPVAVTPEPVKPVQPAASADGLDGADDGLRQRVGAGAGEGHGDRLGLAALDVEVE